jgi:KAT8 regulatory NSL complex subunit 1
VTKFTGKKKLEGQLNFIGNDLIKEIQTEPGTFPFNNLTTLAIASARRSGGLQSAGSKLGASESVPVKEGRFMMSNCDPSMGDQEDNMGLQKSNSTVPCLESGNFLKEKILSSDMDQLFKNLGAAISISDLGGSVDLGQNVAEELLQVIKSMESNPTEPDVPLHGESVGMDPSEGGEPEGMFAISDGTDIGSGLSTFERLLNDVDMMNMCVDVNLAENSLVTENKEALTKERIEEARKKQFEMERKCEWLLRRLRKLQARTMGKHVSEEVTGLLENAHRMLNHSASQKEQTSSVGLSSGAVGVCVQSEETSAAKSEISRKEKKVKGISTFAMANLFRRLDMLSQQQAAVSTRNHSSQRYFGSGSGDHASSSSNGPRVLPKFSAEDKNELEKVSGQLHTQLKMVENFVDSDATASSSGGESCDEMQPFNNQHQMHVSIAKRAAWKWAQDRAGVASRWMWLQAQISDLEYRIRQHNEIHRQIRAAKGPVTLGEQQVSTTSTALSPGTPRNNHMVVNGFHGLLPGGGTSGKPSSGTDDVVNGNLPSGCGSVMTSARVRPLVKSTFRKRKLLQTSGLHLVSKKAARPSSVRCGCRPPLPTCALCTGRTDPMVPQQPDLLTVPERISLLNPTFHPVLSFPEEVPECLHYDAVMKTPEWQQKALRISLKSLKASGLSKIDKETGLERRTKKQQMEHRRKYTSRLKKTVANTLTAKIKRKLTKGRKPKAHEPSNHSLQRLKRKRQAVKTVVGPFLPTCSEEGDEQLGLEAVLTSSNSKNTSPIPSPCPIIMALGPERFSSGKERGEMFSRRKRENSYDIDNIVIPYSIAASTRVEKLQYKEIPTPKWRCVQFETGSAFKLDLKNNGVVRRSSQDSDVEDLNEETISARHDRCELEEKKKFMSYIKLPHSGRTRAHRRTDSRAESSGANTPDPMSPNNMLDPHGEAGGSPLTSPPATPIAVLLDDAVCQPLLGRRRTMSQSRWAKDRDRDRDEPRSSTPDSVVEMPPYEPRIFPLADDVYEKMLKAMPEGHPFPPYSMAPKKLFTKDNEMSESRPVTPSTDSTESAMGEGEDPNDPEWTVEEEREFERERLKASIKR